MFLFSLDKYPGVELLDRIIVLFKIFWRTSILFSMAVAPIYLPTNSAWRFPFSPHPHQYLLIFCLIIAILTGVRWCLYCGFGLHFPHDWWRWTPFHLPADHLYVFLAKISLQILCLLCNQAFCFFLVLSCVSYFCMLDINPLSDVSFANIFSYSVGGHFLFVCFFW